MTDSDASAVLVPARDDSVNDKRSLNHSPSISNLAKNDAVDASTAESAEPSIVDQQKLMRKIDFYIIPWLSLLYLLNSLDRATVGNAKLYGMSTDLKLSDKQYLIALTCFFFPYALFEPLSNVLLKRLRPSRWLPFLILGWGVVLTMHGVVKDYGGLVTVRVLLGLFESGLYPGIAFYLSCWYSRTELGTRIAFFFTSATIAGAFGGLLAAAISSMDGIGGKRGWEWIFIIEGVLTVVVAVISFWMVHDFPDTARFLNAEERAFVVNRLQSDQQFSAGGEKFQKNYVWQSLTDVKTWLAMGIYMGFDGPLFAFSLFTPTIINELGYASTAANLLSVPVYAWGCLVTLFVGFFGDRFGQRAYLNMALFAGGYIILIASRNPALSYFACFLGASGIYPLIPNSVAWVSANTEGSYKRSAVLGIAIGWGNLNGAVTSNVYRSEDKPWYSLGHGIVLAYIVVGFISSLTLRFVLKAENARRARGERDEIIGDPRTRGEKSMTVYESIEAAKGDKGDWWSGFRYTL